MTLASLPPIALAQMDVRPGRPDLNLARMLDFIGQARQANAEIIVFSELCVCGYLIGDLWEVDALVETISAVMVNAVGPAASLSVPLVVEAGSGDNWDEAH